MTNPPCIIHPDTTTRLIMERATDYITGDAFALYECPSCGLVQTHPRPTDLSPYYPRQYRRYMPIILTLLKLFYRIRVNSWLKLFDKPGRAFEMGCGDGFMLACLRDLGWEVLGNERTEAMTEFARTQLGIDVFSGDLADMPPMPPFQMIILFQVLEHLSDPLRDLKILRQKIAPDGKIIIGVPNFGSWQAKFGKDRWLHLEVPRHLNHFTPTSLTNILALANFKVVMIRYASPEHDPIGWIQTILNRIDTKHNRLFRLLMRLDKPDVWNLLHVILAGLLLPLAIILSVVSWWVGKGGLMQVIAEPTD